MTSVGAAVAEIRVKVSQSYRILYIAKFADIVYVLHAFMKKTQKTPKHDIDVAKDRLKTLLQERRAEKQITK